MPKAPPPSVSFRKPQAGRPFSEAASTQAQGPRALQGAMSIPIEQIVPDPDQPRRAMDDVGLRDLAASLTEYGVLQPLLVREDGYLDDERARYRIIAGGRRYAAALVAGLARLPVVVRETEGAALRVTQLIENVQREDLTPLEEARAFKELMDTEGIDTVALGKRLHVTGQHVRDRLLLLTDEVVASAVQRQQITPTAARNLLRLPDESRTELRARIDAGETLDVADIKKVRARDAAGGVVNPRATGGGRGTRQVSRLTPPMPPTQTPPAPRESSGQQTRFARATDHAPTTTPLPAAPTALDAVVRTLDADAVDALLTYGEERAWSCAELARAVRESRG
jgi:ParB/RepB/Spo0J family partition protein